MTELEMPARRARGRLWLSRWLGSLGWTLAVAAGVFSGLVLVHRLLGPLPRSGAVLGIAAAALAGLAVFVSLLWAWATRESLPVAAAQLDRAAGLKERLSTGLYCESLPNGGDAFARAVVADALRVARTVTPSAHLPIRFPRSGHYAGLSLGVALMILWLFPAIDVRGTRRQQEQRRQQSEAVQRTEAQVRPVVQQTIDRIRDEVPALRDELAELEPFSQVPLESPLDVRREAMKKIEQIADRLESKRDSAELARVEEFKRMLRRLAVEQKSTSAVGRLAESLAKGDFKSAQAAIAALQNELARTPATPQEQQQVEELKKQLADLSEKLNRIASEDRKLEEKLREAGLTPDELRKALADLKKGDAEAVARQLEAKGLSKEQASKMMKEIQRRCQACNMTSRLASRLGMAASPGGAQGAAPGGQGDLAGLAAAGEELSQAEALEQELKQLDSALAGLQAAQGRLSTACKACNGTGQVGGRPCSACQGSGMGRGLAGGAGQGGGMGPGAGPGEGGVAPKEATDARTVAERTPIKNRAGSIISQQFIDGEQFKGEVSDQFREAAISARREVTDAVAREEIPRQYHGSVKEYFTRSARGLNGASTRPE